MDPKEITYLTTASDLIVLENKQNVIPKISRKG